MAGSRGRGSRGGGLQGGGGLGVGMKRVGVQEWWKSMLVPPLVRKVGSGSLR